MNYTIIGYTESSLSYSRCGDNEYTPGELETKFFRESETTEFIKAWAHAVFHTTYENLSILINGAPEHLMDESEWEEFEKLEILMRAELPIIKAQHEADEKIRKEAAAQAALTKARMIAEVERQRDLQQLQQLQRKLGLSQ